MYSLGGRDGIFIPSEKPHIDLSLRGSQGLSRLGTPLGIGVTLMFWFVLTSKLFRLRELTPESWTKLLTHYLRSACTQVAFCGVWAAAV
jgi:hypothetical protein